MSEAPPQIGFVSLGCPKNLVDSERILTQLRAEGYGVSPSYTGADLVVVNTCGFIDSAVEESLDAIGEALAENGKVVVTGCLGVKEDEVRQAHPDVLAVTGPHSYEEVMGAIHQHLPQPHDPYFGLVPEGGVKLTPRHYAYLKISEGCNHRCTFCIIPQLRGDLVSRPIGEVVREAENLVDAGVRELLVVSQDTSAYGVDLKYRQDFIGGDLVQTRLKELCGELGELQAWTRLMYVYPYPSVDDLIPLMADGQILPYLDMPLQHGSEEVLRAMKRPAATEKVLDRIKGWREACPDLTLRSTFIVGFPGETEAQFSELLDFLREAQLDRVGCFPYSPVEGATANALPGPVPDEVKEERFARFMEVQSEISAARLAAKVGQSMIVLVDEVSEEGVTARGPGDAPEIDGNVFIEGDWELEPGDFVEVKITGSDEHDLYAEPLDADG
ncbi:MAG: 30S ribosomal protein S12 methylthiotransferase RimO [Candidatus Sedimenticola sp. PURPLELP]